ncbi:MAG: hypothetical protein K8R92_09705 [Planctomycetes bacterium]|nr:hypothetical protein [Planctomycetota bacterium]
MTSIGLSTLMRQAAQAAREGDPGTFAQVRASIETVDRLGDISRDELDLLQVVAAARLGDTELARSTLLRLGLLSARQQQELFGWLTACPEMEHARFREFVTELGTLAKKPSAGGGLMRSRKLTLILGAITITVLAVVVVLIEFVLPKPAAINARNLLISVSHGDARLLASSLPRTWRDELHEAAIRLANGPVDPGFDAAQLSKSLRNLQSALLAAHASKQAKGICKQLVGSEDDIDVLKRLAEGIADIAGSGWMNPGTWKERMPWESDLSANARLAWRTLLAHAPLAPWSDRLFDGQERILPLESSDFFVTENSSLPPKTFLAVQGRKTTWQLTCVQVDGVWVPVDWAEDWERCRPWITGSMSTAHPLSDLEKQFVQRIDGVASWLTRCANSSGAAAPTDKEAPWWISQ